ncbi:hypothetical protein [Ectobacillus panaciterrae]|nr:hypothetical protein [Ectobacillus panaciterrae]
MAQLTSAEKGVPLMKVRLIPLVRSAEGNTRRKTDSKSPIGSTNIMGQVP